MGKLNSGDPLRSITLEFNRHVDASNWFHAQKEFERKGSLSKSVRDSGIVKVKNSSGGDLPAGSCLQLGAFLLGADHRFDNRNLWLDGDTPGDPLTAKICILKRPLPDEEIGEAFMSGVCVALVNVTDTAHTHAGPFYATTMESGFWGPCEILSPLSGTGEQNCIVRIGGPQQYTYVSHLLGAPGAIAANTETVLPFNLLIASEGNFTIGTNAVTLNQRGQYRFHCRVTAQQTGGAAGATAELRLYRSGILQNNFTVKQGFPLLFCDQQITLDVVYQESGGGTWQWKFICTAANTSIPHTTGSTASITCFPSNRLDH